MAVTFGGAFPFQWGTAAATIPVTPKAIWVYGHPNHGHRVWPMLAQEHHVAQGKVVSIDPTLETFKQADFDG